MNKKINYLSIAEVYSSWAESLQVEDIPKNVIEKLYTKDPVYCRNRQP